MRSTRRKIRDRRKTRNRRKIRGGNLFSDLANSFMYSVSTDNTQFSGSYPKVNPMWTVQPIGQR